METRVNAAKPSELKALLCAHGFSFKKSLGQNFLIDERVLARIVEASEAGPDDGALEIGPGAGVVTQRLAPRVKRLVAVEKDERLRPVLAQTLAGLDNVDIRFADVLEVDLAGLWSAFSGCARVTVVANLPYYVTTPILFHVLESRVRFDTMVIMVQREVADRLAAAPGSKTYGALTLAVRYWAEVETVCRVGPGAFLPPPEVESTVVRLRRRATPAVDVVDERTLFGVIRAAFATRRKTLLNALTTQLPLERAACLTALTEAGIAPQRRGETLSLEEFARLADAIARTSPADGGGGSGNHARGIY
ncbi:16S rRNA (adenine(1518)-N(6)/adenine(1519)-N(6))-dimethyltransferase RsmA [Alicyclobacillus sp.]|uniref:16S rRNA (adenine(1518)-N(6)/adenine(1519)-N(6))- dimethyltransferase RsmA n=1 Tax=Alicyclobacillus sp. TaxID=61169 RepID=UPI0025C1E4BE|nr:16S rRNA (adenine(1518)-N(6)/adenine(1519)-N(6))-dimethyltransferase RsmA [Alicyclobacillus sp.]MCL6516623.1 16S rRNA (adenine(1518)-N(6)/adenine(1519)-N(6))-dimethyltransferase RsmA [Alicyclobacillus sp.]